MSIQDGTSTAARPRGLSTDPRPDYKPQAVYRRDTDQKPPKIEVAKRLDDTVRQSSSSLSQTSPDSSSTAPANPHSFSTRTESNRKSPMKEKASPHSPSSSEHSVNPLLTFDQAQHYLLMKSTSNSITYKMIAAMRDGLNDMDDLVTLINVSVTRHQLIKIASALVKRHLLVYGQKAHRSYPSPVQIDIPFVTGLYLKEHAELPATSAPVEPTPAAKATAPAPESRLHPATDVQQTQKSVGDPATTEKPAAHTGETPVSKKATTTTALPSSDSQPSTPTVGSFNPQAEFKQMSYTLQRVQEDLQHLSERMDLLSRHIHQDQASLDNRRHQDELRDRVIQEMRKLLDALA